MALAHMLAIQETAPTFVAAAGNPPLLDPDQVVLFAHSLSHATRFERGEIERLGLARLALEEVRGDRKHPPCGRWNSSPPGPTAGAALVRPELLVRWSGIDAQLEPRPRGLFCFELTEGEWCSGR